MVSLENETALTGVVTAAPAQNVWQLRLDDGETVRARRAVSCLVEPCNGDKVALLGTADTFYIVHILERETDEVTIRHSGRLGVAVDSLEIEAASRVGLVSPVLTSTVETVRHFFGELTLKGALTEIRSAVLRTFSSANENTHVEVTNRSERSFTYVSGHEEVQTKSSRHLSEENRVVQAQNIVATAEEQVKIDGENIQLA